MRSLVSFAALLGLLSSCVIVFDDEIREQCDFAEPAVAPAPLRNPENLTCQSFGPSFECPPGCACPELAEDLPTDTANLTPPIPSWGSCNSLCQGLSETACTSNPACRVVKDASCGRTSECLTDYLGCFPTDGLTNPALDCFTARDGQTCSQSAACTAYHRIDRGTSPELAVPFAMCAPEGKSPGTCFADVVCDRAAPACPPNSRPGIADGCYTGACIPVDLCEPIAQQWSSSWPRPLAGA